MDTLLFTLYLFAIIVSPDAQSRVSLDPMQLPEMSDEVHVQVMEDATKPGIQLAAL